MNDDYGIMFVIACGVVILFSMGFGVGLFVGYKMRKTDDAFNPPLRPDRYYHGKGIRKI